MYRFAYHPDGRRTETFSILIRHYPPHRVYEEPSSEVCIKFTDYTSDRAYYGVTRLHPRDQFCRRTGRRLAFDRALWEVTNACRSGYPSEQRSLRRLRRAIRLAFWQATHDPLRHNMPPEAWADITRLKTECPLSDVQPDRTD